MSIGVHLWLMLLAVVPAPGWEALRFPAPVPGSYELPALGDAGDGAVLDTQAKPRRLYDFLGDKLVVLAFVYRSCPDMNGCPLANFVLSGIQKRIQAEGDLRDHARLISMSFDPARDSPEMMRHAAETLVAAGSDWQFLTTASEADLAPILRAYGQSVHAEVDADGKPLGTISHTLRVYLIDRDKRIRNIYSSSFLHADTVTSDLLTLQRADSTSPGSAAVSPASLGAVRAPDATLGLPPLPVPHDDPLTAAKIALGRKLFFDRRLSRNDTFSCAMCHIPDQGFTNNTMATAVGIEGKTVRRNASTLYNSAYAEILFHDGRERLLEQQIWGPLLAANEMGNPSVGFVLDKIRRLPDYNGLFEGAFAGRAATMETLGMALSSYERTLVSGGSPFDRWKFGKDEAALPPAAQRGFALFTGKAGCVRCHTIEATHALFSDQKLHNTGVGVRQMRRVAQPSRVQLAPGVFVDVASDAVGSAAERPPSDLGRYEITEDPADRWKYKTPTLRNVALTAPYMHDGSIATLREVVEYYDRGGEPSELLDPAIRPLRLDAGEKDDLVAFLQSLTGANVDAIVADAGAAPIGDPR